MNLIKNIATVGGWTLVYRISCFIRDIVQSSILGAGLFSDVFSLSFKFSNSLRKLFAEGAFNASFLPIFSNSLKEYGKAEAQKITSQIFTLLVFLISFLMIICLIFFREIMVGYAVGIDSSTEKFCHLVSIGRICSPYIATSFLVALLSGILNTLNRFALPAATQLILNTLVIIALFVGPLCFPSTAYTMAWATFLSGLIQVVILWINVRYCGFNIVFDFSSTRHEVKTFLKNFISGAIGAGVWQLNVLIDFIVLSFLPTGAISYFYYTEHVNQLPIGILGIAFSTALLPPITLAVHSKNNFIAQKQMNLGLLFALTFTLPASIILISLSEQITCAIYGHGNFTSEHVAAAAPALAAFGFGLPAYMVTKVFSTVFFAHKDTHTPFNGGIISMIVNLLFIAMLMPYMKHTGIAMATTLSSWCNGIYLAIKLKKLGTIRIDRDTINKCSKQLMTSMIMLISITIMNVLTKNCQFESVIEKNIALLFFLVVSVIIYLTVGKILGIFSFMKEIKSIDCQFDSNI